MENEIVDHNHEQLRMASRSCSAMQPTVPLHSETTLWRNERTLTMRSLKWQSYLLSTLYCM